MEGKVYVNISVMNGKLINLFKLINLICYERFLPYQAHKKKTKVKPQVFLFT